MRKGIHYWALPHRLNLREKMQVARKAGFEGVELVLLDSGELCLDSTVEELKVIRKIAREEKMEITALSSSLNWKASLTSGDKEIREKAKALLVRQIEVASVLEIEVILALPGFVSMDFVTDALHQTVSTHHGSDYFPGRETVSYEEAYERALEGLGEVERTARREGIVIGVENIWNHFLLSPLEMRDFIDQFHSPNVQVYFDVGNVMPWGVPQQWIRILGPRIRRVHVKDFVKGHPSIRGFVDLLSGDVDFREVKKALKDVGYDGWLTAEVSEKEGYPEFAAYSSSMALDFIMK